MTARAPRVGSPGTPPVALTVAGSDSGGGAGLQADLATFAALGVHGASAVTAVTVQDTTGVHAVHPLPPDVVAAQVEVVLRDLAPAAVKVGMLGSADVVEAVAIFAARGRLTPLVVDPVLVATSGDPLAGPGVPAALADRLLPHAALVTPNVDEAAVLLGRPPADDVHAQAEQARALRDALGCGAVVVTGGSVATFDGTDRVDVLVGADGTHVLRSPEVATRNDHGTGCTFASAAAAFLAHGADVPDAVRAARAVVRRALLASASWRLGAGRGPVAHTSTAPPTTASPTTDPPTTASPTTDRGVPS